MELFDYQEEAIERLWEHPNYALFFRMGRGKTLPTLIFLEQYIQKNPTHKVLIIAPLSVAENTWDSEIEKWGLKLTLTKVLKTKKVKALQENVNIYITNRESVTWLHDNNYINWDVVVVDELSSFKDSKSKRYKALKNFNYNRFIGLTGSPASNNLIDLWAQMDLVKEESLFRYKSNFTKAFFVCTLQINNIPVQFRPVKNAKRDIFNKISPYSMYKESVNLPHRYVDLDVYLDKNELSKYKQLEKDFCLGEIEASNIISLNSKLRQLASGNVIVEKEDEKGMILKDIVHIHDRKIDKLKEFIELQQGNNILIWYQFIESKNSIINLLEKEKINYTENDVKGWNEDKYRVYLSHPKSGGMGINLQQGGHVVLWYDLTYSLEEYEQANARLLRTGQKNTVEIFHFLVKGTLEKKILNCIKDKNLNQNEFLKQYKDDL